MTDETQSAAVGPTIPRAEFPLKEFLGFDIVRGNGSATATLDIDERHLNPYGIAHGAVSFTLMDTAMGGATMTVLAEGQMCATVEMQTRYHRPAGSGRLTARANVLSAGRRVVHLEARTVDDDGNLIASATASFAVIAAP